MQISKQAWQSTRAASKYRLFIDGKFRDATGGQNRGPHCRRQRLLHSSLTSQRHGQKDGRTTCGRNCGGHKQGYRGQRYPCRPDWGNRSLLAVASQRGEVAACCSSGDMGTRTSFKTFSQDLGAKMSQMNASIRCWWKIPDDSWLFSERSEQRVAHQ